MVGFDAALGKPANVGANKCGIRVERIDIRAVDTLAGADRCPKFRGPVGDERRPAGGGGLEGMEC